MMNRDVERRITLEMLIINTEKNVVIRKNRCSIYFFLLILIAPLILNNAIACSKSSCISLDNYKTYDSEAWWISGTEFKNQLEHKSSLLETRKGKKVKWNDELFALNGHTLAKGKGDVLAFFRSFRGFAGVSDTSNFIRMTIYNPEPLKQDGEIRIGKNSGAIVFVSGGASSFREFCVGYALTGTINYHTYNPGVFHYDEFDEVFYKKVLNIDKGVIANISIEFTPADSKNGCESCVLNANLLFKENDMPSFNEKLAK